MKICAIICEYNPLHYGHLKHIQESKELSGADAIMCIMAGNFSQRGNPTIVNKYVRARMALDAGADIVVQIPTAYVCSSAETFALAGGLGLLTWYKVQTIAALQMYSSAPYVPIFHSSPL